MEMCEVGFQDFILFTKFLKPTQEILRKEYFQFQVFRQQEHFFGRYFPLLQNSFHCVFCTKDILDEHSNKFVRGRPINLPLLISFFYLL